MADSFEKFFIPQDAKKATNEIYFALDRLGEVFGKYELRENVPMQKVVTAICETIQNAYLDGYLWLDEDLSETFKEIGTHPIQFRLFA